MITRIRPFALLLSLFAVFIVVFRIVDLYVDFLWFKHLNFDKIFVIGLEAKVLLFFAGFILVMLFILLNLWISGAIRKKNKIKSLMPFGAKIWAVIIVSYIMGSLATSVWLTMLRYIRQTPFDLLDPIFSLDISFYIFSLPFYLAVWRFAFAMVLITLIFVLIDYLQGFLAEVFKQNRQGPMQSPQINFAEMFNKLKRGAVIHLSILSSTIFILLGLSHYLSRYQVMFSEKGIVIGAGYTDVVAYLPAIRVLMILAFIIAALFFVYMLFNTKARKLHMLGYTLGVYLIVGFLGLILVPGLVQTLRVAPNEINLEKPYIENNIKFTRLAYGLDDVAEKDFEVELGLSQEVLFRAKETVDNIRILDWRPLTTTYQQTQEIRLYYDLAGIDIDRYDIDGKPTQVLVAPRELNQNQITDEAKTWVNLHMVYSHGYGVVMSPVNEVTDQGLPEYYVKDIPPAYTVEEDSIKIDQPEIYYGETDNNFVLVNTDTEEFNYPKGNTNEYVRYDGSGGVLLDSFFKKLLMAVRFKDLKILLSTDLTTESRIMFHRSIQERIRTLTPFFTLDSDPYMVIDQGRLYWIQDAYVTSSNYPYSQKFVSNQWDYFGINYIRNSVKIVVDAYDGDVTYYVMDTEEPIIATYSKIFWDQFKDFSEMPAGLTSHIRYPEDLFKIQTSIFSNYHMTDPTVFYNKEDAWQLPKEIYGTGEQVQVEPYYNILKLPGEEEEEFVLMISFTPIRKDNMVAWLAARSDGDNYGRLLLFKFPKDKLVYGPSQIEARIDQDSEISQQLTLWSQQGSRVTRGNLLVIPIEDSILYVEPLYIQSEQGQLPELKRVLVSDGNRVAMEVNLGKALEALFGKKISKVNETTDLSSEELIQEANSRYEDIQEAMKNQDWSAIGENLERLGEILSKLKS